MTKAVLKNAWGYQGDAMNLPVANIGSALPFYERVMDFRVESQNDLPNKSAVLERDGIRMRLAENGGDPSDDGCAFEVENVAVLHKGLKVNLESFLSERSAEPSDTEHSQGAASVSDELKNENRKDGSSWKVFFVIAPDGLCYWFGERQTK